MLGFVDTDIDPTQGMAILFALALLASGQSSSIIDTMAGQTVAEGFLQWRLSVSASFPALERLAKSIICLRQPVMRRLLTRSFGLIPSMIVAVAVGKNGVDAMLVASQVVLSIVLPFIVFPLMLLTCRKDVMTVKLPPRTVTDDGASSVSDGKSTRTKGESSGGCGQLEGAEGAEPAGDLESAEPDTICYANNWTVTILGWILWVIVVAANVYAIVTLGLGTSTV